jgi:hypothetical protein
MHRSANAIASRPGGSQDADQARCLSRVYADLRARNERRTRMAQLRSGNRERRGTVHYLPGVE